MELMSKIKGIIPWRGWSVEPHPDTAKAEAKCVHGVLTVRIPRTEEAKQKVRRIPIKA